MIHEMTQIFQFLCSSHHICMINWYGEEYIFWPTDIRLLFKKEKWLEEEVEEELKMVHSTWLGSMLNCIQNEKEKERWSMF